MAFLIFLRRVAREVIGNRLTLAGNYVQVEKEP